MTSLIQASVLCRLCADAYAVTASYDKKDVHATISMINGVNIIAFRGSSDLTAWWRDFFILGEATWGHPELGLVHAGMFGDVLQVIDAIDNDVGAAPIAITGHSKGGGEAQILAAVRLSRKRPVFQVTTFGAPRVGHLGGWLGTIPGNDYRNADDPVPTVPGIFQHPRTVTQIGVPMQREGVEAALADHLIPNYEAAIAAAA
jgi:hypothetical protein